MDQSSSVISQADSALYITFFPSLAASPIRIPITTPYRPGVFVCANSLVVSDKVVHAKTRYNLRFFEILVSARILARILGVAIGEKEPVTMREVVGRWLGGDTNLDVPTLKKGLEDLAGRISVMKLVDSDGSDGTETGVTLDEMITLTGMSKEDFEEVYLSNASGTLQSCLTGRLSALVDDIYAVEATHFQLYKRTKHVLPEAWRVLEFHDVCLRAEQENALASDSDAYLRELGSIMDASHKSCSELCENSCPEVDLLVRLAKEAGAYGSRVTGD